MLGDSAFVLAALEAADEHLQRAEQVRCQGRDLAWFARQVALAFGLTPEEISRPSKHRPLVASRSVVCYLAVHDLGLSATTVARALDCTRPAVSIAVRRGEQIATSQGIQLAGE